MTKVVIGRVVALEIPVSGRKPLAVGGGVLLAEPAHQPKLDVRPVMVSHREPVALESPSAPDLPLLER